MLKNLLPNFIEKPKHNQSRFSYYIYDTLHDDQNKCLKMKIIF